MSYNIDGWISRDWFDKFDFNKEMSKGCSSEGIKLFSFEGVLSNRVIDDFSWLIFRVDIILSLDSFT